MNFILVDDNHGDQGLGVAPLVIGESGSCFEDINGPDTLIAFGGCPTLNDFDVLDSEGSSTIEMSYGSQGSGDGAVLGQMTTNGGFNQDVGVILSGFSFHEIRDDRPQGVPDRAIHLQRILNWLQNVVDDPVAQENPGYVDNLAQNYPNPFNPTTTVRYSIKERAHVTLRIYNVAGQLVRTLVDEVREPGISHSAGWNGRNGRGQVTASGVYFYKLVAKDFTETRKMVLLK